MASFKYTLGSLSGLRNSEGKAIPSSTVSKAITAAKKNVEALADIKFQKVASRGNLQMLVGRHRDPRRPKGVFDGKKIWLNTASKSWTGQANQIRVILEHELGHFLGLPHYGGSGKWIMSINVGTHAVWKPSDIANLVRKFGKPQSKPTASELANRQLAKEMRGVSDALKKDKIYKRQQAVTIRASIVRLRQMQRDYGLPK